MSYYNWNTALSFWYMVLLSESHLNEQAAGQNLFSLCCRLPSQTNPLAGMRGREGQLRHGSGCIHNHFLTPEEVKIIVIYFTCKLKTSLVNLSCNATEFLRAKTFFPCLCFPTRPNLALRSRERTNMGLPVANIITLCWLLPDNRWSDLCAARSGQRVNRQLMV